MSASLLLVLGVGGDGGCRGSGNCASSCDFSAGGNSPFTMVASYSDMPAVS